jgi:aryl-phospho-beta-D-glucosidase BglC (GH1 family)
LPGLGGRRGSGTTAAKASIQRNSAYCAHSGTGRAWREFPDSSYLCLEARDGGLYARTALRTDAFHIKALNWFGAEGNGACPDGLWQRPASAYLDFAQSHGFNALRMPLAVDNVLGDPEVNKWSLTADPALQGMRSLQVVERIVRLAARRGLLVMLDMHRLRASVWPTTHGLWFDEGMPAERLEAAWRKLARRFCAHWNVVASDLFNEPWGVSRSQACSPMRVAAPRLKLTC